MRRLFHAASTFFLFSLAAAGCDGAGGGSSGPLTRCDLSITEKNPDTGDFLEGCESDADCDYGVCLKPGDGGNLTNAQFGFCTRGCECGDDPTSQLSDAEKTAGYSCLYPPTPNQHRRHLVLQCGSVAECQAFDSRWNACRAPSSGGTRNICHAD